MEEEYSSLHVMAECGYKHITQYLITTCNADVNAACGEIAWTPLQAACLFNKEEIVRVLLDHTATDVNKKDGRGATALTYAVDTGNVVTMRLLLGHDHIDEREVYRYSMASPIYIAAVLVNPDPLRLLLHEYKKRLPNSGLLNATILVTLFQRACRSGFVESAKELIMFGNFDINEYSNIRVRFTALQSACTEGQINVVKFLIAQPDIDLRKAVFIKPNIPDKYGLIFLAASQGRIQVLELLLRETSLCDDCSTSEAIPYLLQFAEKALSAKYAKMGKLLLLNIEQHLCNDDVAMKVIQSDDELTGLMACAINNSLKSTARCIDTLYLSALKMYAKVSQASGDYVETRHKTFVERCYTDSVIYGCHSRLSSQASYITDKTAKPTTERNETSMEKDLRILFQAVNFGLSTHVEVILKETPELLDSLAAMLPEKRMSVLQCSMQNREISYRLLDLTQNRSVNVDTDALGDFKAWYTLQSKLSSDVRNVPVSYDTNAYRRQEIKWVINELERHETHTEYELVRSTIEKFLLKLSEQFTGALFEFEPIRVGSSSERTRPFIPNEFDYLLLFKNLSKCFDCKIDPNAPGVLYYLQLKEQFSGHLGLQEILQRGLLSTQALNKKIQQLFKDAIVGLFTPTFGEYLTIETPFYEFEGKMIHSLRLVWRGNIFKDMEISIDLVPAFGLAGHMPYVTTLAGRFASGPFYLFTKPNPLLGIQGTLLPVAFSLVENKIIRSLPKEIRLGFKLAKALRRSSLMSNQLVDKLSTDVHNIDDYFTTYMLKTALFFLLYSYGFMSNGTTEIPRLAPLLWTKRIYQRLLKFIKTGYIPVFFESIFNEGVTDASSIFSNILRCEDPADLPENSRRSCCLKRQNLIIIAEYMIDLVHIYLYGEATTSIKSLLDSI